MQFLQATPRQKKRKVYLTKTLYMHLTKLLTIYNVELNVNHRYWRKISLSPNVAAKSIQSVQDVARQMKCDNTQQLRFSSMKCLNIKTTPKWF